MPYRFFYIGPREVNLLLQDAFTRAKDAKLTGGHLSCYDVVPKSAEQNHLNKSKFGFLVRELWSAAGEGILFYDPEYDSEQLQELLQGIAGSGAIHFPLRRPVPAREECDRAALMMMSTPAWTQSYLHQTLDGDDTFLAEYERLIEERNVLKRKLVACESAKKVEGRTISQVVADFKKEHHPHTLVITDRTEKTAATCRYDNPLTVVKALDAIAAYVHTQTKSPGVELELKEHFNKHGFNFAPTNTAVTKEQQGDHYEVKYGDRTYTTHMHLKKGPFRLYFHLQGQLAVIGAIGDHLPTAAYRE